MALVRRRSILFIAMLLSGGLLVLPRLPLLLLMMVLCIAQGRYCFTVRRQMWPVAAVLLCVGLLTILQPFGFDASSLATRFANFMGGWMLLRVYLDSPDNALAEDLAATLKWLALQAVLTVPVAVLLSPLFADVDINGTPYKTFLFIFTHHTLLTGVDMLPRPDGFFYEPGVFQFYLNLYLYVALFVVNRWRNVLLALLAVLSTQSTTGIAIAALQLALYALSHGTSGSTLSRISRSLLVLALLSPVLWLAEANISDKLIGDARGSAWAREYDFFTGLNLISQFLWTGIGFDQSRYLELSGQLAFGDSLLSEDSIGNRSSSNGLIVLFYSVGVPVGSIFLIGLLRQRLLRHRLVVACILVLTLFSEALIFTPFILMFVFSGFLIGPAMAGRAARRTAVELLR
jgi:hypothetical protein